MGKRCKVCKNLSTHGFMSRKMRISPDNYCFQHAEEVKACGGFPHSVLIRINKPSDFEEVLKAVIYRLKIKYKPRCKGVSEIKDASWQGIYEAISNEYYYLLEDRKKNPPTSGNFA